MLRGDGICCIDLDDCVTRDGTLAGWAQDILHRCPATYVELSPSGRGLHIWGQAYVGVGRKIRRGVVKVEVYDRGRYVALGRRWGAAPGMLGMLAPVVESLR